MSNTVRSFCEWCKDAVDHRPDGGLLCFDCEYHLAKSLGLRSLDEERIAAWVFAGAVCQICEREYATVFERVYGPRFDVFGHPTDELQYDCFCEPCSVWLREQYY